MIIILRLNHRIFRDKRITSHVALTARAFLADKIYYSGEKDSNLENSINKVSKQFGGNFNVEYCVSPIEFVKHKKSENYKIIHLTVYGLNLNECIKEIRKFKKILIIVGGEKVPIEYYDLADLNLSITNQPHSEVSSLAIFLHEFFKGKELSYELKNPKIKILPQRRGKKIIKLDHNS